MILTGPAISQAVADGKIVITPYDEARLNDASYDLRLGNRVAVYKATAHLPTTSELAVAKTDAERLRLLVPRHDAEPLDAAKSNELLEFQLAEGDQLLLKPGIGYLLHTAEKVLAKEHVPVLDGKSSIGRLFVSVHQTAGYGEPGFDGQWTFEVICQFPVKLYVGMRVGQMRFHVPEGEVRRYGGNYQGQDAMGPVGSRSHKQIEADVAAKRLTLRVPPA